MSDKKLRDLERRAQAGDREALDEYLAAKERAGQPVHLPARVEDRRPATIRQLGYLAALEEVPEQTLDPGMTLQEASLRIEQHRRLRDGAGATTLGSTTWREVCLGCGRFFEPRRAGHRHCGPACRKRARRRRERGQRQAQQDAQERRQVPGDRSITTVVALRRIEELERELALQRAEAEGLRLAIAQLEGLIHDARRHAARAKRRATEAERRAGGTRSGS